MADEEERQFLLGIFLMEAWDALATLESGVARLRTGDGGSGAAWEPLLVVAHRVTGTAALQGFPGLSALTGVAERLIERAAAHEPDARNQAVTFLSDLVGAFKQLLDRIGATGCEDVEVITEFRARHPALFGGAPAAVPAAPPGAERTRVPPADRESARGLSEIERFFSENTEILPYFGPEATEHLETMTRSLLRLDRTGRDADELATLFRAVHTLKGAAYTVGCGPVGDLSHRIEDLLVEVREGRLPFTTVVIEAIFAGVDALRLLLGSAGGLAAELPETLRRAEDHLVAVLLTGTDVQASPTTLTAPPAVGGAPTASEPAERPVPAAPDPTPREPATPVPVLGASRVRAAAVSRSEGVEPALPSRNWIAARARRRPAVPEPATARPGLRVNLERLDALMNLVGELVIARSRLDRRVHELDSVGGLLITSRARMARVAQDFEDTRGMAAFLPLRSRDDARTESEDVRPSPDVGTPVDALFAELEFDRYDNVDLLARSVAEISADLAEVHGQLAGLVRAISEDTGQIQRLTGSLRAEITRARMIPVGKLFARFARQLREAAKVAGKTVMLDTSGESVEVDNTIIEQIADPLLHLAQNAVAHGIESEDERQARGKPRHGTVTLRAAHRGGFFHVEVEDDGRGIDPELVKTEALRLGLVREDDVRLTDPREAVKLVFLPGFSTTRRATTASGRGVGLDVVRTNVSRLNGEIDVETEPGIGTCFRLKLPLTVVISDALMVRVGPESIAFPLNAVQLILTLGPDEVESTGQAEMVRVDGQLVDLIRMNQVLGLPGARPGGAMPVLVLRAGGRTVAVAVDELLGKEEIVIKGLGGLIEGIGPFAGATISGEGRVILLVDPLRLVEAGRALLEPLSVADDPLDAAELLPTPRVEAEGPHRVLLVDDSISVRKFVGHMLERARFHVITATDGTEALEQLGERPVDIVITDLEMPRLNGYELIRALRVRPTTRDVPVVVLTTRSGDKHVALARQLGVRHYVTKPVEERAFVRLIESAIRRPSVAVNHAS